MTGNKTPLTLENIGNPSAYGRLYGLTSVDDDAQMVYSLFGGQAGKQTVSIENLTSTKTFEGAVWHMLISTAQNIPEIMDLQMKFR